jgi:hypothetical protein
MTLFEAIAKGDSPTVRSLLASDPLKVEKEGDEEIDVAGKKIQCHWIEGTQKASKAKFWISKDIPGGVAGAEMTGGELPGVVKFLVVSWEQKQRYARIPFTSLPWMSVRRKSRPA